MTTQRRYAFSELEEADLVIDAVYEGGSYNNVRDDPIAPLLGVGLQGGFRYRGSVKNFSIPYCVLYTDMRDADWPDRLDFENGIFTYYGDNKQPGSELHMTPRGGNLLLKEIFHHVHQGIREAIPPIFVFTKGGRSRDVVFRGLAVPGASGIGQTEDLVAIWKTKSGERFQNYRSVFTILDVPVVSRAWINELRSALDPTRLAPIEWLKWRSGGDYAALKAPRTKKYRTHEEQLPHDSAGRKLLQHIVDFYRSHPEGPYGFEKCAATIVRLMDSNVAEIDLTRPWRDGGRDALGKYRIGCPPASIKVDFALEAKCKGVDSGSGVRETARLLARIRHRQFGIFVTTSFVATQAYQEIIEDDQPIIILAGIDIIGILTRHGLGDHRALSAWLASM